jgi:hypothetical protein
LPDARTEHDDPAANQVLKAARTNMKWKRKRNGMADVIRLGDGTRLMLVHQDDLASHALHHEGVAGRGAHEPAANDADLHLQPPVRLERAHW